MTYFLTHTEKTGFITSINWLMVFREINHLRSLNHVKYSNEINGKIVKFVNVE